MASREGGVSSAKKGAYANCFIWKEKEEGALNRKGNFFLTKEWGRSILTAQGGKKRGVSSTIPRGGECRERRKRAPMAKGKLLVL